MDEEYEEQERQYQDPDAPRAENFDDYDEFVKAQVDYHVKKASAELAGPVRPEQIQAAVAAGVQQGITPRPQQPQLSPYPDDELAGKRAEILERARFHHKNRILAEAEGNRERAELHAYHGRSAEKELEALPKSKAWDLYEEALEKHEEEIIGQLYNEEVADDPAWQNPRLQHDSAVELIRRNLNARVNKEGVGTVKLVMLDAPWGNPLPVCPKNMAKPIELPRQVFEQFKREVRSDEPVTFFRQAHNFLERHGYGSWVEPAFGSSERGEVKEGEEPDLARMTYKQFEAYRNKQEREKRGEVRMFPERKR